MSPATQKPVIDPNNPPTMDNPHPVKGSPREQAGFTILGAHCPRCGQPHHVNGPGKSLCPCGVWLLIQE